MKRLNQKGFGAIEALLVIVVLALIGGAGWYVLGRDKSESTSTDSSQQSEATKTTDEPSVASEYISVPTWGVKIGIGSYGDKVTVSGPKDIAIDESEISILIKKEFDVYEDCQGHLSITRLKDISEFDNVPKNKIGDFYYYTSGIAECGGSKESTNTDVVTQTELKEQFDSLGVKSL